MLAFFWAADFSGAGDGATIETLVVGRLIVLTDRSRGGGCPVGYAPTRELLLAGLDYHAKLFNVRYLQLR